MEMLEKHSAQPHPQNQSGAVSDVHGGWVVVREREDWRQKTLAIFIYVLFGTHMHRKEITCIRP